LTGGPWRSATHWRLQHIEGCVQRGGARRIPGALVILLTQPRLKALATKRPGFLMVVNDEIGKTGAVACVKQLGGGGRPCCSRRSPVVRAPHGNRIGPQLFHIVGCRGNRSCLRAYRGTRLMRISRIIEPGLSPEVAGGPTGSMPVAFHHACSSLARWTAR
jgi:hypothetical protein